MESSETKTTKATKKGLSNATALEDDLLANVHGGTATTVTGTDGADYLSASADSSENSWDDAGATIDAGAGDDVVTGSDANDDIDAGAGNDQVYSGYGDDTVTGGAGDDTIDAGSGNDTIDAGAGDDTVMAGEGADVIDGGLGDDTVDGGSGSDTYIYRLGGGNDTFSGGDGSDTISVSNLTSTDGWTVKLDGMDSAISVEDFQDKYGGSLSYLDRQAADHDDGGWGFESNDNDDGYTGVLTAPNGDTVSFDGVDSIDFEVADDPVSGGDYPLVVDPDALPDDATAYVVSGLPAGVTVNGQAEAPQLSDDGTYFQVVDPTALQDGQLSLDFNTGYFGSVDLTVTAYQADSDGNVSEAASVENSYSVAPTDDAVLFAQAGAISVEDEEVTSQEPFTLDTSAVDTSAITSNVNLNTNLPAGATILDADGNVIATQGSWEGSNNFSIDADQLEGMQVDLSGCSNLDQYPDSQEWSINIEGEGFGDDGWNEQDATITFTAADGMATNTVQTQGTTPLDVVVNPNLDNAEVAISGIPAGASILDADGNTLYTSTSSRDSFYIGIDTSTDTTDLAGLQVDTSGASDSDFTLSVQVFGTISTGNLEENDGVENVDVTQEVYVNNDTDLSTLDNGDTQMIIHGSQDDYSLDRVGNSLVITSNDDPTVVTRVAMADVDYILFDPPDQHEVSVSVGISEDSMRTTTYTENPSSMVAMSDFVKTLDVSSAVEQLGDDSSALLVITGLPDGACVDGAVDLGNGAYGIRPSETDDGSLNIELPVIGDGLDASVNVSAYAMTDAQSDFLDGAGRVYGYASASADAEAGASVNFGINEHGLTAGASAYADAEAVATAGGSITLETVTVAASVSTRVYVQTAVSAQIAATDTEAGYGASANAASGLTVSNDFSASTTSVPGTGASGDGTAGVYVYAGASAEQDLAYGDDEYGASGSAGVGAGAVATAKASASAEVGGIGGDVSYGLEAGLAVGAKAGGTAMYDHGEITLGLSGEACALLGFDFDFDVTIDTNEVADTAKLVASGAVSAWDAVEKFGASAEDLAEAGIADADKLWSQATSAIESGVSDAYNEAKSAVEDAWNSIF